MGWKSKADVPGTFKSAPTCKRKIDGVVCGKPAFNWLHMVIKIMERETKVRVAFCDSCFEAVKPDVSNYSISGARPVPDE